MKRFETVKMPLFDSSNGNFKVSVEVQLSRKNPDGSVRDLVYATDKYTGVFNPNIYLLFSYKSDDAQPVYMSYPQLYILRKTLRKISALLDGDDSAHSAFLKDENGMLSVNAAYSEPFIIDQIGKNSNWISFQFKVIQTGENGVYNYFPGVTIELSTSNGYTSLLSEEEFHTVETILNDLDLISITTAVSLAYLSCDPRIMYQQPYYQAPQMPMAQPYNRYPQAQMQPQAPYVPQQAPQQQFIRPRYNNTPAPQYQQKQTYRAPVEPAAQSAPVNQAPQQQTMQARPASTPVINMKAVEQTPVSEFTYDDTDAINEIFNTAENE